MAWKLSLLFLFQCYVIWAPIDSSSSGPGILSSQSEMHTASLFPYGNNTWLLSDNHNGEEVSDGSPLTDSSSIDLMRGSYLTIEMVVDITNAIQSSTVSTNNIQQDTSKVASQPLPYSKASSSFLANNSFLSNPLTVNETVLVSPPNDFTSDFHIETSAIAAAQSSFISSFPTFSMATQETNLLISNTGVSTNHGQTALTAKESSLLSFLSSFPTFSTATQETNLLISNTGVSTNHGQTAVTIHDSIHSDGPSLLPLTSNIPAISTATQETNLLTSNTGVSTQQEQIAVTVHDSIYSDGALLLSVNNNFQAISTATQETNVLVSTADVSTQEPVAVTVHDSIHSDEPVLLSLNSDFQTISTATQETNVLISNTDVSTQQGQIVETVHGSVHSEVPLSVLFNSSFSAIFTSTADTQGSLLTADQTIFIQSETRIAPSFQSTTFMFSATPEPRTNIAVDSSTNIEDNGNSVTMLPSTQDTTVTNSDVEIRTRITYEDFCTVPTLTNAYINEGLLLLSSTMDSSSAGNLAPFNISSTNVLSISTTRNSDLAQISSITPTLYFNATTHEPETFDGAPSAISTISGMPEATNISSYSDQPLESQFTFESNVYSSFIQSSISTTILGLTELTSPLSETLLPLSIDWISSETTDDTMSLNTAVIPFSINFTESRAVLETVSANGSLFRFSTATSLSDSTLGIISPSGITSFFSSETKYSDSALETILVNETVSTTPNISASYFTLTLNDTVVSSVPDSIAIENETVHSSSYVNSGSLDVGADSVRQTLDRTDLLGENTLETGLSGLEVSTRSQPQESSFQNMLFTLEPSTTDIIISESGNSTLGTNHYSTLQMSVNTSNTTIGTISSDNNGTIFNDVGNASRITNFHNTINSNNLIATAHDWSIFSIGMSLTYQCSNGYTMTGGESSRVLGCSGVGSNYAVWDGDFSPCLRNVNCTSEYRPYMRMTPDSGVVSVGNTVEYTCDPPYVLDNGDITGTNECTMYNETHGTWNTTQPSCEIAECPVIDHGRSNRNATNTSLGTTVKITCKKGYVFSNYLEEVIIRCEFINGTGAVWSEALPRCRENVTYGLDPGPSHGRLLVYLDNSWGAVSRMYLNSDKHLRSKIASATCRSLGFIGGEYYSGYNDISVGSPPSFCWLTNPICEGDEATFEDCRNWGFTNRQCDVSHHLYVTCFDRSRVMISYGSYGYVHAVSSTWEWQTVCDSTWTDAEAGVLCRQKGFSAGEAYCCSALGYHGDSISRWPHSDEDMAFQCGGNETNLANCNVTIGNTCRYSFDTAGVLCYDNNTIVNNTIAGHLTIELMNDYGFDGAGDIIFDYGGIAGTVCDTDWTTEDATVACKMKGYIGGGIPICYSGFENILPDFGLTEVNCTGNELTLLECSGLKWTGRGSTYRTCSSSEIAGVVCYNSTNATSHGAEYRLQNMMWIDGAHSEVFGGSDGVVQVKYHGVWGTVGRTGWSDAAAAVVCSRLGYRTGIGFPRPVYRSWKSWDPSLVQWYDGVQCGGNETSLEACAHSGTCHYANHLWDVSVSCFDTWEGLTVRFAAVFSFFSNILGTLVVEHQGSNGFVCTDGFDDMEASIICRANGYKSGRSVYHHSLIDYFRGPAWISQLNCSGSEGSLTDCPYVVNDENCYSGSWLRRAAVLCLETIDPQESIHYRLEEDTTFSGKVMVGVNGLWKPVSERDFATTESTVFCRQMGFDYGVRYTYGDAGCIDSNSRWDMWLTVDECNPDYHTTLEECTIEGRYWQGSIRCRPPRVLCYFEAGDVCTGGASQPDVIEHKWGQIRSPRRPTVTNSDYDVQCWWLLQVPRQYVLNVEMFVKMDATNLTLYDGSSVNSNVLLFLSGSGESEQTLQATGHQLLIHYDQASYTDYFILGYEAVCNSILGVPAWRNTANVTSLYGKNVTLLFTGSDWNATCENFSSECLSGIQACQLSCDANTYCWTLYYDIQNGSCYIGVRSYQYGKTVDLTDVHLLQYEIDCTVNGSWSAWSSWSHMPVTCGSGVISRTRTCTDPSPHFGGSDCEGNSTEETLAYSQNCPVPCPAPNSTNDSFLIPISNRSYYLWNEQLDVFCVPGYSSLSGQTEYTITCGYNGTWDMENVTCVLKSSIIDSETVNYNHSETSMVVTSVSLTGMEYTDSATTISYSSLVDSVLFNVSQEYSQSAEQTLLFPSASVLIPSNENNATDLSEGISTISFDGTSPPSSDLETDFISTSIDSIFISNLSTSLDTLQPEEVSDMASTYVQSGQSNNSNVSEAFQSTRGQFSDLMNMASSESISFLSALTPFPSLFRSTQEETVTNIPSVPSSVSESYSPTIFAAVHDFSSSIESFSYFSTDIGFVSPDISFVLPPTSGFSSDISSVVSSGSVAEMSSMFSYPQLFSSLLESAASLPSSENVSSLFPTSLLESISSYTLSNMTISPSTMESTISASSISSSENVSSLSPMSLLESISSYTISDVSVSPSTRESTISVSSISSSGDVSKLSPVPLLESISSYTPSYVSVTPLTRESTISASSISWWQSVSDLSPIYDFLHFSFTPESSDSYTSSILNMTSPTSQISDLSMFSSASEIVSDVSRTTDFFQVFPSSLERSINTYTSAMINDPLSTRYSTYKVSGMPSQSVSYISTYTSSMVNISPSARGPISSMSHFSTIESLSDIQRVSSHPMLVSSFLEITRSSRDQSLFVTMPSSASLSSMQVTSTPLNELYSTQEELHSSHASISTGDATTKSSSESATLSGGNFYTNTVSKTSVAAKMSILITESSIMPSSSLPTKASEISSVSTPDLLSLQILAETTVSAMLISEITTGAYSSSLETITASAHIKNTGTASETSVIPIMSISNRDSPTMPSLSSFSSTREAPTTESLVITSVSTAISPTTESTLSFLQTSAKNLALSTFSSTQEAPATETPEITPVGIAISPTTEPNLSSLQTSLKTTVTANTTSDIMTGTESSSLRTTTASTRIKNTKTRTVLKTSERPVMSTSNRDWSVMSSLSLASYSSAREALATETPDMTSVSRSIFVSQSTEPVVSVSTAISPTTESTLSFLQTSTKNLALSSFSSTQEAPSTETPEMTAVSTAISPSTQPNLQTSTKTTVTATTTSDIMTGTQFSTLETSTSSSHVKNTITNPTTTGTIITTQVSTISASSKRPTTTTTTTTKTTTVTKSTTREPLRGCSKADISVTNAEPDINMAVVPAGTLVQFSCVTGHIFQSGSTRKNVWCFNTEWQTPSVTCVPISCGSISKENAVLSPNRTEYVYGDEIEVTCVVGYSYPNGSKKAAINCTESGDFSYSTLHECEVVRCPSPPNVTLTVNNASTTGPVPYGTVIAYNCTENRTYADGSESRSMFCADNGKWSKVISGCLEQAVVAPVPRKRKHNPEPKEATGAIGIGAVGLSVVCGLLGCILALDISTLGKHLRLMKRNLGFRIQRKKAHRQPMELI